MNYKIIITIALISTLAIAGCTPKEEAEFETFINEELSTDTQINSEEPEVEPETEEEIINELPTTTPEENDPAFSPIIEEPIEKTEKVTEVDYGSDPALYTNYTASLQNELQGKKPYAIFFHADWCPKCVDKEKKFKANLSSLPNGLKVLKANYDSDTALKQKYGVNIQSTVVIINSKGEVVDTLAYTNYESAKAAIAASL